MLLSIIPVCVTLLLGIGGFIVNTLIQRKTNSIEIITKNRISRMEKTKKIMSEFIKYSDIDCLEAIKKSGLIEKVIIDLNENYANLRSIYTYTFYRDLDLLLICKQVKNLIVSLLMDKINTDSFKVEMQKAIKIFEKDFDLYICTDWNRIKAETVGKRKKGGVNYWEDDYDIGIQSYRDEK